MEFLDLFAQHVDNNFKKLRTELTEGLVNKLDERFKDLLSKYWLPLQSRSVQNPMVMAVDGSRFTLPLPNGGFLYVVQALGIGNKLLEKELSLGVAFSKSSPAIISEFINRKMEWVEFKVAEKAIKNGFSDGFLLIDGSLYGRAVHLPKEIAVNGCEDFMLDYFETYLNLLKLCRENNVALIGLSKMSRTTILRDFLLSLMLDDELDDIKDDLETNDLQFFRRLLSLALDDYAKAVRQFERMKMKYGSLLNFIGEILNEIGSYRSDYQLILRFSRTEGYSKPLKLGPSVRLSRIMRQISDDLDEYINSAFSRTICKVDNRDSFFERAKHTLPKILDLPCFITFHVLLSPFDVPIRVDLPGWCIGIDDKFVDVKWPTPIAQDVSTFLSLVVAGYCGPLIHNIWLYEVDRRVKMHRRTMVEVYMQFLERKLNVRVLNERATRGYEFY